MDLLVLDDDLRALPAPELVAIAEFQALIKRDRGSKGDYRGDKKQRAMQELAYIFHCISYQSPYANYHIELREEKVRQDIFWNEPTWKADAVVEAAMEKYRELTMSTGVHLLNSAMIAAQKLGIWFEEIDLVATDTKGKLVYSARDVVTNLGNLGKVVEGLSTLREQVEREQIGTKANRKSVETNKFSQ